MMRIMVIVRDTKNLEAGVMPDEQLLADDFGAEFTPERRAQEVKLRAQVAAKN